MRQKRAALGNKCVENITLKQKVGLGASKTRTLKQKVRQKHVPLGKKSGPRCGPGDIADTPSGFEQNGGFVILDEFSRAFGDLLDRTPKRRGVGER